MSRYKTIQTGELSKACADGYPYKLFSFLGLSINGTNSIVHVQIKSQHRNNEGAWHGSSSELPASNNSTVQVLLLGDKKAVPM